MLPLLSSFHQQMWVMCFLSLCCWGHGLSWEEQAPGGSAAQWRREQGTRILKEPPGLGASPHALCQRGSDRVGGGRTLAVPFLDCRRRLSFHLSGDHV